MIALRSHPTCRVESDFFAVRLICSKILVVSPSANPTFLLPFAFESLVTPLELTAALLMVPRVCKKYGLCKSGQFLLWKKLIEVCGTLRLF